MVTERAKFVAGLAGILTVGPLPAVADTVGIGQYVALGDSYAAGQGGNQGQVA
jgi:hypothetical protein